MERNVDKMDSLSPLSRSVEAVLQNEYIVEHIFGFLSVIDLKSCRLVKILWKNVGNRFLRRKSCVKFCFLYSIFTKKINVIPMRDKMMGVIQSCKSASDHLCASENTPFHSFDFSGPIRLPLLVYFVKELKNHIKDLKINGWELPKDSRASFSLNTIIGPFLNKLACEIRETPKTINFTLQKFAFLQNLELNHCEIIFTGKEEPLSLKKLTLGSNNRFIQNGKTIEEVDLLTLFNLQKTEDLRLFGTKMMLDFSKCNNKQICRDVYLSETKTLNWENCDWKFKRLILNRVSFFANTTIEIHELSFESSTVHLSSLANLAKWKTIMEFSSCKIVAQFSKLLHPKKLQIWDPKFIDCGTMVESFHLHTVFDLSETENLNLRGENIVLDFACFPETNIQKEVELDQVKIRHWGSCGWKFKKLSLRMISVLEKALIDVEVISVLIANVDFSQFPNPNSVKKVECTYAVNVAKKTFFFPNVTTVKLHHEAISALAQFQKCENMIQMHLSHGDDCKVNVKSFPKNIQLLILENVDVRAVGVCNAETLVLRQYDTGCFNEYANILNKFKGKNLFIWQEKIWKLDLDDVAQFLIQSKSYDNILIGEVNCDTMDDYEGDKPWEKSESWESDLDTCFQDCQFSKMVNNKHTKFYFFRNSVGVAMESEDFKKLLRRFEMCPDVQLIKEIFQTGRTMLELNSNIDNS